MNLSDKMEDYLEAIYRLSGNRSLPVRNKELASFLEVDKATAAAAVKKLSEMNLADHQHYGYIVLKDQGEKIAEEVYFKHQLLKKFLMTVLQVEENQAEKEACLMEHGLSEETAQKMKNFLDHFNSSNQSGGDHVAAKSDGIY